ncbi:MAG: Gfo/Idh/MocA family oxidoreductase [Bifidobacteriaceae bacterium]|nr:Gfo/Idh/MocA family oxidoreductase [Bifidobacteriaceae bacterium]
MKTFTVGLIGAGPVTQAIHLPTLARLDGVRVAGVMDPDMAVAQAVAATLDVPAAANLDQLLQQGVPDIAVIGSPNAFHATQILTLVQAGVRGILAEKPLVMTPDEAQAITAAIEQQGTALVVGAMHTYDPGWLEAQELVRQLEGPFHVRSTIYLPANARFEDRATNMVRPAPAGPTGSAGGPPNPAQLVHGAVMGLAIHALPLIRGLIPAWERVEHAAALAPWGYNMTATGRGGTVELLARMPGTWRPDWQLGIWGAGTSQAALNFPPSYVHNGSAWGQVTLPDGATKAIAPHLTNGYVAEWQDLLAQLTEGAAPRYPLVHVIDDVLYAIELAGLAAAAIAGESEVAR